MDKVRDEDDTTCDVRRYGLRTAREISMAERS